MVKVSYYSKSDVDQLIHICSENLRDALNALAEINVGHAANIIASVRHDLSVHLVENEFEFDTGEWVMSAAKSMTRKS